MTQINAQSKIKGCLREKSIKFLKSIQLSSQCLKPLGSSIVRRLSQSKFTEKLRKTNSTSKVNTNTNQTQVDSLSFAKALRLRSNVILGRMMLSSGLLLKSNYNKYNHLQILNTKNSGFFVDGFPWGRTC